MGTKKTLAGAIIYNLYGMNNTNNLYSMKRNAIKNNCF